MKNIEAIVIIHLFVVIALSLAQVTVSWDVNKTEEFKNGDTMELICTVTGTTCCSSLRSWNGGSSFSTLMNNGVPSNAAKYHEVINTNSFSLFIYNMNRSDFLYDYRCSYGFDESPRSLLSPPDNARYVPIQSEIDLLSSSTGGGFLNFVVNVTTVFPAPSCTATFKNANLTSSMTFSSTDNFPFKFAVLSMTNVSYTCQGPLNISCSVGSYSFNVLTIVEFCACSRRRRSTTNIRKCVSSGNDSQAAINRVQPYIFGGLVAIAVYVTTETIDGLLYGFSIALLTFGKKFHDMMT